MRLSTSLFLSSSVFVLTLLPTATMALRIETISNAISSSSSTSTSLSAGSSVVKTTGRASNHRAVLRAKRLEWSERAAGKRPLPSSSSAPIGTFGYQPYKDGVLGKGQSAILYFYAPWSRNCQGVDELLTQWAKDRLFVLPMFRVDYDTARTLRATYGVKYVNSYVQVDGNGTLLRLLKSPQEAAVKAMLYND